MRSKPEAGLPDTARLRVNRFLNMTGRSGRTAGNALGVLGLFFAGFESFGLGYWSDGRIPDSLNSIGAGDPSSATAGCCLHWSDRMTVNARGFTMCSSSRS